MNYSIAIERRAVKFLARIPAADKTTILNDIQSLAENPRPPGSKKLLGREAWRIRTGQYRIIYEIYDKLLKVIIITIGDRKDVYR